ncbi:GH36-type glycosyl hydrolase domain-containing protein [Komagataeibacter oboediens]|uniref:Glycosyl transferase n=1 Tax=Komagataeibacter oboediens TaxID=65958 RepID=A0ABS5SNQ6_9PROT|nr:glucoamylase family protein [Komagataeibacter oboediens]MBL7232141.1 glycosyl transferase [Komagataeibacter oboediens]MBT0675816.1 glycosyl transferase [Komagataeibacter oboediens]MBT0677866.1 glycosyl transferase [Komagataeibacter oboediens]
MDGTTTTLPQPEPAVRSTRHPWLARLFGRVPPPTWEDDFAPLKSEIFGMERLEAHARSLAAAQTVAPDGHARTHGRPLSRRLAENGAFLRAADVRIAQDIQNGKQLTPAAQWLADNYALVDMQIRETDLDLPASYYARLPKLANGPFAGLPRVFGVTWALVAHTDSNLQPEILYNYLQAYQSVTPLTIGELWAVPITLRIVLIENLRRVVGAIMDNNASRRAADQLADQLAAYRKGTQAAMAGFLAAVDPRILNNAFTAQLVHRSRGLDPEKDPALVWLEQRMADRHTTIDDAVHDDLHEQGTFNATIRNIITSLRLIAGFDWTEAFERVSLIDRLFADLDSFTQADFASRDLYRKAIEDLARGCRHSEMDIARQAVAMAHAARDRGADDPRRCDPGYYLLMAGRSTLEAAIGFRPTLSRRLVRSFCAYGITAYSIVVTLLTLLFIAIPVWLVHRAGMEVAWALPILAFIPVSEAAVACVNRLALEAVHATTLPGLEFLHGIPAHLRTMLVVPALLTTEKTVDELVARLEVHYLSVRDDTVHFALLTDWTDHDSADAPDDQHLLALARAGIDRLNRKYGAGAQDMRFYLLHRRRVWCESERVWMGWERKRGKLHELNRLLRGATDTTFLPPGHALPAGIRYVITLDADTRLPLETVCRLIGKMAHPLNAPRFDPVSGRVHEGYAILQPRVTPSLPVGHQSTLFQRIFASASGIDAYSAAVSDLYQDMFGEGSYAGKGIYDIDAFEAALARRVPESTMLSHDLFEGIFARAGLVTDIEVVEEFPTDYLVAAQRLHRWTRGDWQLLPWIVSSLPPLSVPARARLSGIARWKMLDNLRRTMCMPLALASLVAGWFLPFHAALIWTTFMLAALALPAFLPVLPDIVPRREWITLRSYLNVIGTQSAEAAVMTFLTITFLAHQSVLMTDAITRTLVRVLVTRRHLLQWVPAAQIAGLMRSGLGGYYGRMFTAPLLGWGCVMATAIWAPWNLFASVPVATLWCLSPAVAMWASRTPVISARSRPSRTDTRILRMVARRTWRFFETFTTPADHMLPPDNFQEDPAPVLARRTSPTNIGLYLLCCASARDFGWIGLADAVARLEATFATLETMPRYRGHFYNWYATDDLRPLDPVYISSVDSGNLAGHLVTLSSTCQRWRENGPEFATWREGVTDALNIAITDLTFRNGTRISHTPAERQLLRLLTGLKNAVLSADANRSATQLSALRQQAEAVMDHVAALTPLPPGHDEDTVDERTFWISAPLRTLESHLRDLDTDLYATLGSRLETVAQTARRMAQDMDFAFLCNPSRKLLSIGYLVGEDTQDANCYDLLASEARLAVFFAIAKGDMPAHDWFRLGRSITPVGSGAALVSWSGSMFEYLMPSLVMRAPMGSLLEQTNKLIVQRQIAYGQDRDIPWGISESAYNARDLDYTYQYSNFGIPGLGLKRGLGMDTVVAPYATMLAAMIDPQKAVANLHTLERTGALGRYGLYEALDYTPDRVPDSQRVAIIRAYMAHHQGMSILAVADAIMNGVMRARFHDDPVIASAELLLQERAPRTGAVARPLPSEDDTHTPVHAIATPAGRYVDRADMGGPVTHLLSNGRYTVMLTAAGSGYSRWQGQAITRWREDATRDEYGQYLYIRNRRTGRLWSAGIQPTDSPPDEYAVVFHEDRAEFARRDGTVTTTLDVLVSAENDAEVRQVSVFNAGSETLDLDITSYAELALLAQNADLAHPAFTKLFVQTEHIPQSRALIATRRRRTGDEPEIWVAHLALCDAPIEIETDRARFIGRRHDAHQPAAMATRAPLSGTTGTVLDAVFSIRARVSVRPGAVARVAFWTMVAPSRAALLDLIDTHQDHAAFERARTLAWTQAQVQLRHLDMSPSQADLFQRLAGHIVFATRALRASPVDIAHGAGAQPLLWEQGISGDLPIVVLRVRENSATDIVRILLLAQEYFRLKQLAVDLVILNEHPSSYLQDLQVSLDQLVRASPRAAGATGSVRVLRADLITPAVRHLIISVARVVLDADHTLSEQLDQGERPRARPFPPAPPPVPPQPSAFAVPPVPALEFFNGHGGFAENGREYVIVLGPGQTTPAPWINVIANDAFGFQVSGEGSGYTWSGNSREHQITPWSNDPVTDHTGEVFYFRDEDTGTLWCPTAATRRDAGATYLTRHGRGYTRLDRVAHGVASSLLQYVPVSDPVKITRIQLHNQSDRSRTLSVTAYVEWVLGPARSTAAPFIMTERDGETGALFARNRWNAEYADRTAFADIGGYMTACSGDRATFIGPYGTMADPLAFAHANGVQGATGAGLDPCGVVQTMVTLPPGGRAEIVFLLGEGTDTDHARALIGQYRTTSPDHVLEAVHRHWDTVTGAIQVQTPDRTMDIMLNGWLLYQSLASRVQARAGFYQASGAYGFRDQLQDGMALALSCPDRVRAHLLRAASRQFIEGDVQHWWLPNTGAGVRTHISDDCAWLAHTVAHYVTTTGDTGVLDECIPFLEAPPLPITEHDRFMIPAISGHSGTLFEHCARALDHSLATGSHGLPLMGTGDWNDGMNRVGEQGRGESVWLGWFLHDALTTFIPLARARGDDARVQAWQDHAAALATALEATWDGDWYLRAYFDDGTPLGSHTSAECQIDAISQSWSVLSGVAVPERAQHAMRSAMARLVRPDEGLVLVLTPPFDAVGPDPGYIRSYPPGIRENGGQYTHAALWTTMAMATLGDGNRAHALFHTLNPINHASSREDVARYRLEPYVVAADIYSCPPHVGRGGWSWYTGSAGWMQRVGTETILGLRVQDRQLLITPCIPDAWPGFTATVRWRTATYHVVVHNPDHVCHGIRHATCDGNPLPPTGTVEMVDDGQAHSVEITLGPQPAPPG